MAGNEGIFTRWSRLKRRAAEGSRKAGDPEPPEVESAPSNTGTTDEAAADLAQLPSLDSINATTDIRGFLAAGVPKHLRNAALRRAWSADPAIRDFIGPNENFWDHSTGNIPGFKQLASDASSQLLARVLDDEPLKETSGEPVTAISETSSSALPSQPKGSENRDDGSETKRDTSDDTAKRRPADNRSRHHGGAVPHFDQK